MTRVASLGSRGRASSGSGARGSSTGGGRGSLGHGRGDGLGDGGGSTSLLGRGLSTGHGGVGGIGGLGGAGAGLADGDHGGVLAEDGALGEDGADLLLVLRVPGHDLGRVAGVLLGERGRGAEGAGVGLRVLDGVGEDLGRGRGQGRVDVEEGGLALGGDAADAALGGGLARLEHLALHLLVGHEVGGRGGGQEGGGEEGVGEHLGC